MLGRPAARALLEEGGGPVLLSVAQSKLVSSAGDSLLLVSSLSRAFLEIIDKTGHGTLPRRGRGGTARDSALTGTHCSNGNIRSLQAQHTEPHSPTGTTRRPGLRPGVRLAEPAGEPASETALRRENCRRRRHRPGGPDSEGRRPGFSGPAAWDPSFLVGSPAMRHARARERGSQPC